MDLGAGCFEGIRHPAAHEDGLVLSEQLTSQPLRIDFTRDVLRPGVLEHSNELCPEAGVSASGSEQPIPFLLPSLVTGGTVPP